MLKAWNKMRATALKCAEKQIFLWLISLALCSGFRNSTNHTAAPTQTLPTTTPPDDKPQETNLGLLVVASVAAGVITIIVLVGLFFGFSRGLKYVRGKLRRRSEASLLGKCLAEFMGTFILMVFGVGSVAQMVLGGGSKGSFFTVNLSWGLGVALGVSWSAPISGGHINPAVTLAMAIIGRFPFLHVPLYIFSQCLGAFAASACVYGVYADALKAFDGGARLVSGPLATAGIWSTYPQDYLGNWGGFIDQLFATALLVSTILAIVDKKNMGVDEEFIGLVVGLLVAVIGMSFGLNCGYGINPARDLMPRVFTFLSGWGKDTFLLHGIWSFYPVCAQFIGGIVGALLYVVLIEAYHEEVIGESHPDYCCGCCTCLRRRTRGCISPFLREVVAEFCGTFIMMVFVLGSNAQYILGRGIFGDFLSTNFGYGLGMMFGLYWSAGVSGGHLNPAIGLPMCISGKTKWKKLPAYCFAQLAGAFAASFTVFAVYKDAIESFDNGERSISGNTGTGRIFATFAAPKTSVWTSFGDQLFTTALLSGSYFILSDVKMFYSKNLVPLMSGLLVVTLGMTFGINCNFALNPVRELGPRLFMLAGGYSSAIFRAEYSYLCATTIGQLMGGVTGWLLYILFIAVHQPLQCNERAV